MFKLEVVSNPLHVGTDSPQRAEKPSSNLRARPLACRRIGWVWLTIGIPAGEASSADLCQRVDDHLPELGISVFGDNEAHDAGQYDFELCLNKNKYA